MIVKRKGMITIEVICLMPILCFVLLLSVDLLLYGWVSNQVTTNFYQTCSDVNQQVSQVGAIIPEGLILTADQRLSYTRWLIKGTQLDENDLKVLIEERLVSGALKPYIYDMNCTITKTGPMFGERYLQVVVDVKTPFYPVYKVMGFGWQPRVFLESKIEVNDVVYTQEMATIWFDEISQVPAIDQIFALSQEIMTLLMKVFNYE